MVFFFRRIIGKWNKDSARSDGLLLVGWMFVVKSEIHLEEWLCRAIADKLRLLFTVSELFYDLSNYVFLQISKRNVAVFQLLNRKLPFIPMSPVG